jgi:RNA polymerase sigma factor (sigma-70 family)
VKDLENVVLRAADPNSSSAVRREAFGELVIRFQDMAFGCAFAVLGDACLAQDTAQEAFVVAWQKLAQLREPAAFPGWFKRIVLTQCNRLLRCKRLQFLPLDAGAHESTGDPGPHFSAERQQLLTRVLQAVNALPENERLVTTLFYVDGYTQADIGEFLEVPVSTVNKRLYSARQRLKGNVIDSVKDDLKKHRPSRDAQFSNQVNTKLREFHNPDWPTVTAIAAARAGNDTPGFELWVSRREKFDESRYFRRQYVAENPRTKQIVAYGAVEQSVYLPKYRSFLLTHPQRLKRGVGNLLLDQLMQDLREAKAVTVSCRQYASEIELVDFLKGQGFAELSRILDLRLEVSTLNVSTYAPLRRRIDEQGISISTFAKERVRDPRCVEKLYELTTLLRRDDSGRDPFLPPAYNAREVLMWLEMPYVLPEAYFIAKHGDEYVGVSDVTLFEAVPGGLTQGFTGVKREYRRRGLATVLKVCGIAYAQSHGYRIIQSFNKPEQSAIHTLNKKLGFEVIVEDVLLEKCLRDIVAVDSHIYDEFAGQYRDDNRPDMDIVVRNEAGRLTMECVGQKVELFAMSETSFFVKQFYGEVTFHRDERGRADRLDFAMRVPNSDPSDELSAKKIS